MDIPTAFVIWILVSFMAGPLIGRWLARCRKERC